MGFAEKQFVVLVVGWRLDDEISQEFLAMLEHVTEKQKNIIVAFMGIYGKYETATAKFPILASSSRFLGAQDDALAVMECCNLYVNPKRNGGGSSVAEALYKGLPAVTLPVGDVAAAAGEVFYVADYAEMEKQILRYAGDEVYYKEMSKLAEQRAEQLMDSKTSFCKVMQEIEHEIWQE
jgi:glycosyltransferase involved in cell wall biosynthesis